MESGGGESCHGSQPNSVVKGASVFSLCKAKKSGDRFLWCTQLICYCSGLACLSACLECPQIRVLPS